MEAKTHLGINAGLVGEVVELSEGSAECRLETLESMSADAHGLVHGGFVFGLADYAAMLAVNHPNVVLGAAESRFLAPVKVGESVVARAKVVEEKGKKRIVECDAFVSDRHVFAATFTAFVLEKHVLD
jgi:acyl-coenzyme A thioesterase PaaI-like protein